MFRTRYIDEPVCRDRNTDGDPNCLDSGGSERYYYHQDINFRVVALSDESGAVVERYEYTAYGEPRVYAGGAGEAGCLLSGSTVGNPHMHQGLRLDDESGLYENRFRMYHARLGRFAQRDPLEYKDSPNQYEYIRSRYHAAVDPLGLESVIGPGGIYDWIIDSIHDWFSDEDDVCPNSDPDPNPEPLPPIPPPDPNVIIDLVKPDPQPLPRGSGPLIPPDVLDGFILVGKWTSWAWVIYLRTGIVLTPLQEIQFQAWLRKIQGKLPWNNQIFLDLSKISNRFKALLGFVWLNKGLLFTLGNRLFGWIGVVSDVLSMEGHGPPRPPLDPDQFFY